MKHVVRIWVGGRAKLVALASVWFLFKGHGPNVFVEDVSDKMSTVQSLMHWLGFGWLYTHSVCVVVGLCAFELAFAKQTR